MATRMQQRRGTAAQWAAANPVLADGEVGYEKDTGIVKIGNGSATWNVLPPVLGSQYLPILGKANDSERLDGLDSTAFLLAADAVSTATASKGVRRDVNGDSAFREVTVTQQSTIASATRKDYVDGAIAAAIAPLATTKPYWLFTGGNGQAIATNTETEYVPTVFDSSGITRTGGRITVVTAGYYHAAMGTRLNAVGTVGERYVAILQYRAGSMVRRVGMHNFTNVQVALSTSTSFRALAGDVIYAVMYQISGASTNTNDVVAELNFTGHMIRPL